MIQYTSGTTGLPKGALLHHRGVVNNNAHTLDRMRVPDGTVWLTTMPMFHAGGCLLCVVGAVSRCGTQVLVESFDPALVLDLIEAYRCDGMSTVPTMLVSLLDHPNFASTDLSSLKHLSVGGSTVPAALVTTLQERLGAACTILFGQTECSPMATMTNRADSVDDKVETIGQPCRTPRSRSSTPHRPDVADRRGRRVLHPRLPRDDRLLRGPRRHTAALDHEGWLHTGDLCSMDERGHCRIEGRLKDMIIRGGENIYPREIEELLFAHPKVGEVAVIGLPDAKWGEEVAAFIRPIAGDVARQGRAVRICTRAPRAAQDPASLVRVDSFPMTGSGKIQKYKLRQMSASGEVVEL